MVCTHVNKHGKFVAGLPEHFLATPPPDEAAPPWGGGISIFNPLQTGFIDTREFLGIFFARLARERFYPPETFTHTFGGEGL